MDPSDHDTSGLFVFEESTCKLEQPIGTEGGSNTDEQP